MTLEIWPVVFVIPERYWWRCFSVRSSRRRCSIKKVFLKISQYSQENTCAWASFLIKLQDSASNFIKKVTLTHEYSCEFCEIFKNICFEVASDDYFSSAFLPPSKVIFNWGFPQLKILELFFVNLGTSGEVMLAVTIPLLSFHITFRGKVYTLRMS